MLIFTTTIVKVIHYSKGLIMLIAISVAVLILDSLFAGLILHVQHVANTREKESRKSLMEALDIKSEY